MRIVRASLVLLFLLCVFASAAAKELEQAQNEFNQYFENSQYKEAARVAKEMIRIATSAHGRTSVEAGDAHLGLGMVYYITKDYSKVVKPLTEASRVFIEVAEDGDLRTAMSTYYLGFSLYKLKKFEEARGWLERSLPGREKTLGDKGLAEHLMALSVCCWSTQDHIAAVPVLERLVVLKKEKGHEDIADWMSYLGRSLRVTGAYKRALSVYRDSLSYSHRNKLLTARLYTGLGDASVNTGDFATAEKYLNDALAIREAELGPKNEKTLEVVGYLAQLHTFICDSKTASIYWERLLKHDQLGAVRVQVVTLLEGVGKRDSAEQLAAYEELLGIVRKAEPGSPMLTVMEAYRGILLQASGDVAQAEPILRQKLVEVSQILGPTHPLVGSLYQSLALLHFRLDQPAKAEDFLSKGLRLQARAFGEDSPITAWTRLWLAAALYHQGKKQEARSMAFKYTKIAEEALANILTFASERQRLNYLTVSYPYLLPTLGFGEDAAQTVLRNKGVILDSVVEDVRLAEAVGDSRLSDLKEAKRKVVKFALAGQKSKVKALEAEVERLEGQLARSFADLGKSRRALSVTVPEVQAALPENSVLVEYLKVAGAERNVWPPVYYYGVVIIPKTGPPRFAKLQACNTVDRGIRRLRGAISRREPVSPFLKALDGAVWQPVEKALPAGTQQVVISPDSALNLLPFATLLGPQDRFLLERFELRIVATGRDLLAKNEASSQAKTMTVVANPDFGAAVNVLVRDRSPVKGLNFPPLPGTAKEAAGLQTLANGSGWDCRLLSGKDAQESKLLEESPAILHFATHGFFLGAEQDNELAQNVYSANVFSFDRAAGDLEGPMYRSGLALCGAQSTARAWSKGERPAADEDGILTASEAGRLNLGKTLLVTLSACDTGLGQSRGGEGLLGLRRALVQAGAQHILLTLWQVDDQFTAQFMTEFYQSVFKSGRPEDALSQAQRDALVRLRKQRGVDVAVHLAGAFQMSSQGRHSD